VIAGPYTRAGGGGRVVVAGRIQNLGLAEATIDAIEVGWSGTAKLVAIHLADAELAVKDLTSPALIPLASAGPAILKPAQASDVSLVFTEVGDEASWSPGPIAVLFREGCQVAMRPAGPSPCGLALAGPDVTEEAPSRATFTLSNPGADPIDVRWIELTWPAAGNGALIDLQVGDAAAFKLETPLVRAPAALDLAQVIGGPLTVPPAGGVALSFGFEQRAAKDDYALDVGTAAGCATTVSTWVAHPGCGLSIEGFEGRGRMARFKLVNRGAVSRTLTALDVFWAPAVNGALAEVLVDGQSVATPKQTTSPAALTAFDRPVQIGPDGVAEVHLRFDPGNGAPALHARADSAVPDPRAPGERPGREIDRPAGGDAGDSDPGPVVGRELAGDVTVLAAFQGGCQAAFSTLGGGAMGCRVWASEELTHAPGAPAGTQEVSAEIVNTGAATTVRALTIAWPERNGALTGVYLGQASLLGGRRLPPGREPLVLPLIGGTPVMLPRGGSERLRLTFDRPAAPGGYTLLVGLGDLTGQPCAELRVPSPPYTPDCDKVGFDERFEFEGRHVSLVLRNASDDPLWIGDLTLDWPEANGMQLFRLTMVTLDDGGAERTIWLPAGAGASHPPISLRPDAALDPARVAAGATVKLRFTFDRPPPGNSPEFRVGFRALASFAEGCRAPFPPRGARVTQKTVEFFGVVRGFPNRAGVPTLFGCCWQIDDTQGRIQPVEVDRHTRLRPATVLPKRGDIVQISAQVSPDGEIYARQITFRTYLPEETVIGPIQKTEPTVPDPSGAPSIIVVNDDTILISDRTQIEDVAGLRAGARVAARGTRNTDDQIEAARVDVIDAAKVKPSVSIQGPIQEVMDGGQPGIKSIWIIDHYVVHIPDGLVVQGVAPSGRPAPGWEATVEGTDDGDVIVATSAAVLPAPQYRDIQGVVIGLPAGGSRGDWTVRTASGEVVFNVASSAVVNTRAAPVAMEMWVEAVIRDDGLATPQAVSVRMEWP